MDEIYVSDQGGMYEDPNTTDREVYVSFQFATDDENEENMLRMLERGLQFVTETIGIDFKFVKRGKQGGFSAWQESEGNSSEIRSEARPVSPTSRSPQRAVRDQESDKPDQVTWQAIYGRIAEAYEKATAGDQLVADKEWTFDIYEVVYVAVECDASFGPDEDINEIAIQRTAEVIAVMTYGLEGLMGNILAKSIAN